MPTFEFSVLLLASLVGSVLGANCTIPPVYSDIHIRAVHGTNVFQYGSFMGFGNPFQNSSIWPSLRQNETSFASLDFCSKSTLDNCTNATGGLMDYNASTTFQENPHYSSKDTQAVFNQSVSGTDDIHIYTHYFDTDPAFQTLVTGAPIQFALSGNSNPGIHGMGPQSTLLQRLVQTGLAAGRTYSLFIGSGMNRAQGLVNGSNVYGGYDSGRFKNPVYPLPMDVTNEEYLKVTVSNILLNDPTNSQLRNVSIMDNGKTFDARITTDQYPMLFPYQVTQNFAKALDAKPSEYTDKSLRANKPFKGTMTIVLDNGFQVTLPHEVVSNVTGITPVQQNDDKNYDGSFYLSAAWLSEVYLMMDFEVSKFYLAQAIPKNAYVMPKTFCPASTPVPFDYSQAKSQFLKQGLIGAVVGGVIGGSALIVGAIAVFLLWQRKKMAEDQERRWAAEEKKWKGGSDLEMESLTPKSKKKFAWNVGKLKTISEAD